MAQLLSLFAWIRQVHLDTLGPSDIASFPVLYLDTGPCLNPNLQGTLDCGTAIGRR
jgi:hypothetical protein